MANSTAKFYYRSFIDQDVTGYTLSGDFTPLTNLNNRRKNTFDVSYQPAGHDTDGTAVEFIADLNYDRTIDTIFLKSNFKTFTVYIWDENETGTGGAGYVELISYAANTVEFLEIYFEAVLTSKIKIICTNTITANEAKKIYTCEITKYINELHLENLDISQNFERTKFQNIYGGSVQVIKYPNRGKVEINLSWENMTAVDYAVYNSLKTAGLIDSYFIYLYFSDDFSLTNIEALYLVNDTAEKEASPTSETLAAGVSGKMKLLEV
jgi:hypothetical protein